jgi:hypothetical protein
MPDDATPRPGAARPSIQAAADESAGFCEKAAQAALASNSTHSPVCVLDIHLPFEFPKTPLSQRNSRDSQAQIGMFSEGKIFSTTNEDWACRKFDGRGNYGSVALYRKSR